MDECDLLVQRLLAAGGEQHVHAGAFALGVDRVAQGLAVEHDLVCIERQVLVRFEAHRLAHLVVGHRHHRHVAHDGRLTADARDDAFAAEAALAEDLLDGLLHLPTRGNLCSSESGDDRFGPFEGDLDRLDDGRTEV